MKAQPDDKAEQRSFTSKKFDWLDIVAQDRGATHLDFRVAYFMAGLINRTSGDAWPRQATIAEALGVTRRGVQMSLVRLVELGHLTVEFQRGRGHTNRYRLAVRNANDASPLLPLNGEPAFVYSEPKRRKQKHEKANANANKGEPPFAQNTLSNTSMNTLRDISVEFESWWRQYPRRVEKKSAFKAYERIIKNKEATSAELLSGAMRYAADMAKANREAKHVKHPTTWLNKGCWTDEPESTSQHRNPETRNRADSAVDGMRGYIEDPTS
jgi:hypothetical protein